VVELTRCPYDASLIEPETDWRGPARLFCSVCGAAWEWHNAWLRRVREPDRDAILRVRAERKPVPVVPAPPGVSAEATWRRVKSSIASISDGSNEDRVDLTATPQRDDRGAHVDRSAPRGT
jgi:hypothetical protein